jgi:hypothetical protein
VRRQLSDRQRNHASTDGNAFFVAPATEFLIPEFLAGLTPPLSRRT